ncbi:MAG: glycosyltransferase family 4 protein [Alphaproteobacteria bacterium]|nr:glycosyltransferase family 4 protein [Alphaproteobacteria bacterium]
MQKNVLFITRKWPPAVGGMETYCVELTDALKLHVNLSVEALPGRDDGTPPSTFNLIVFGLRSLVSLFGPRQSYDIIHGADMAIWPLVLATSLRTPGAKVVLSAHGSDVAFANRPGFLPFLYRHYLQLGARLTKKAVVIANSHATALLLERHSFNNPIVVPLAAKSVSPNTQPPQQYILFVGRLTKQKGCQWFIENVLPALPDEISLRVVGPVIDRSEEAPLATPRVIYHGPAHGEKLTELRSRALVVIVPNIDTEETYFEGFGLAATEAAAAGSVTLASNVYGLRDAVIDQCTGYLLPSNQPEAWVDKIQEIAKWTPNQRESFITASMIKTTEFFSWDRVAHDTVAAYGGHVR